MVGGSISVAHEYDVAVFGTLLMVFGLVVGTRAYLFPAAGSGGERGRDSDRVDSSREDED